MNNVMDDAQEFNSEDQQAGGSEESSKAEPEEGENFAQLFEMQENQMSLAAKGRVFLAKVIASDEEYYLIDTGAKFEGRLLKAEIPSGIAVESGDELPVLVVASEKRGSGSLLSVRSAIRQLQWERLESAWDKNERLEGRIFRLRGDSFFVGLDVFPIEERFRTCKLCARLWQALPYPAQMPLAEIDTGNPQPLKRWLGRKLPFKLLALNPDGKAIVSRRRVMEEMKEALKQQTLATAKEGDIVLAKVKDVEIEGARLEINGVAGYLAKTETSWYPRVDMQRQVRRGETIDVKILKIDRDAGHILASRKVLLPHPADELVKRFPIKTVVEGVISKLMPRGGCFVRVDHVKREAYIPANDFAADAGMREGDRIKAMVVKIDRENIRVILSARRYEQSQMPNMVARYTKENQPLKLGEILGAENSGEDEPES